MRYLRSGILLVACGVVAGACASTGAVPKPFPTPARSPRTPAAPAPPAAPAQPADEPPDARAHSAVLPNDPEPAPAAPGGVAGTALLYRGVRYRIGGNDPENGFDCSGFVWYVFAQHGIAMPRTVAEQYRAGTRVDPADLRAGDLVFFNTTGVAPSHVGIAVGGEEFVHAPNTTGEVRVERLSASYWLERFVGVRRVE
jgi:cell wall-associated NlpC family hydrolase